MPVQLELLPSLDSMALEKTLSYLLWANITWRSEYVFCQPYFVEIME